MDIYLCLKAYRNGAMIQLKLKRDKKRFANHTNLNYRFCLQ